MRLAVGRLIIKRPRIGNAVGVHSFNCA